MLVNTKLFGSVDLSDDKIITFEQGIVGFENLKKFAIIYDVEKEDRQSISWLQSLDEPGLAFPVIDPFVVKKDYNPEVSEELLAPLGEITEKNLSLLVTLSVPQDLTKMACNIKAPIVINSDTRLGAQIIAENQDYPVRFYIYDILQQKKQKKGEC